MRFFICTMVISIEYSQSSILSTVLYIFPTLKFAVHPLLPTHVFQNTSHCEKNFLWKQLLLSNNYFLVTSTFSDQVLIEDKHLFRTATASEKLLLEDN